MAVHTQVYDSPSIDRCELSDMESVTSAPARVAPAKVDLFHPSFFQLSEEESVSAAKHLSVADFKSVLVDPRVRFHVDLESRHLVIFPDHEVIKSTL